MTHNNKPLGPSEPYEDFDYEAVIELIDGKPVTVAYVAERTAKFLLSEIQGSSNARLTTDVLAHCFGLSPQVELKEIAEKHSIGVPQVHRRVEGYCCRFRIPMPGRLKPIRKECKTK